MAVGRRGWCCNIQSRKLNGGKRGSGLGNHRAGPKPTKVLLLDSLCVNSNNFWTMHIETVQNDVRYILTRSTTR